MGKILGAFLDWGRPTLFIFECVLSYLDSAVVDSLLQMLQTNFLESSIISYDPIRNEDAFGRKRCGALEIKGCPLLSTVSGNNPFLLEDRFRRAGWAEAISSDLKEYAENLFRNNPALLQYINSIEHLDEMEEWNLLHEHYALTYATNLGTNESALGKSKPKRYFPWLLSGD